jgi:hypothetical protein
MKHREIKERINFKSKSVKRLSKRQYNKELSTAEKRIEKGNFIVQEILEKESSKW